jgi:hypothetical protein
VRQWSRKAHSLRFPTYAHATHGPLEGPKRRGIAASSPPWWPRTAVSLLGAGVFTHLAPAARPWDVGAVAIMAPTATDDAKDKVDKQ